MEYLHQRKIMHRDLALRNILLSIKDSKFVPKISDFGLSKHLYEDENYYSIGNSKNNVPIRWTAVEVLTMGKYAFKVVIQFCQFVRVMSGVLESLCGNCSLKVTFLMEWKRPF